MLAEPREVDVPERGSTPGSASGAPIPASPAPVVNVPGVFEFKPAVSEIKEAPLKVERDSRSQQRIARLRFLQTQTRTAGIKL